jgi:hypothetical protein
MATKEPTLPPPKKRLVDHPEAGLALELAAGWRRSQINGDAFTEASYRSALCSVLDRIASLANPPTLPPPPRKQ